MIRARFKYDIKYTRILYFKSIKLDLNLNYIIIPTYTFTVLRVSTLKIILINLTVHFYS